MLPRDFRLPLSRKTSFQGALIQHRLFRLIYARNQLAHFRLGIVVSKKTANKATDRNLVKRRLSHAFSEAVNHEASYDCLLIAQSSIKSATFPEIKKAIKESWVHVEKK